MSVVARFLLYNLLPSFIMGTFAWLAVVAAVNLLSIRQARLRLTLLAIPLLKSALILLGLSPFFLWPRSTLAVWETQAVPASQVLPYVLIWAGSVLFIQAFFIRQARQRVLRDAQPASAVAPRLVQTRTRVLVAFRQTSPFSCMNGLQCGSTRVPEPQLLVSTHLASPVALTAGGTPALVFPHNLSARLDDDELAGAMAHELAHFGLRHPCWCSADTLRKFSIVSPVAWLIATTIDKEEEKACDEIAVKILGKADTFASMLVKSYRFAREQPSHVTDRLSLVPQLIGFQPMLTARVERLLHPKSPLVNQTQQSLAACLLWGVLYMLFLA